MDDLSRYVSEQEAMALRDACRSFRTPLPGLFDALFEESDCGVLILEAIGEEAAGWTIRDANPLIAQLLACDRADLMDRPLSGLLAPETRPSAEKALTAALRGGGGRRPVVLEFRSATERRRRMHTNVRPVAQGGASEGVAAIALLRPLEPNSLERGLEAEAEAARERMLVQVNHDLRTPLNGILGFAQLIEHGFAGDADVPRHREYARDIAAAGRELLGRIEDLLVAAEGEGDGDCAKSSGDSIDLAPLLESAVAEFRAEAERLGLTLTLLRPPDTLRISSSRQDCRRMVSLLLESALRGAPSGSEIQIGYDCDEAGKPMILCIDHGHPLDLKEVISCHLRSLEGFGKTCDSTPPPRSTAGLLALRALAQRNGAELAFFAQNGGGHATSITFPPHTAN